MRRGREGHTEIGSSLVFSCDVVRSGREGLETHAESPSSFVFSCDAVKRGREGERDARHTKI